MKFLSHRNEHTEILQLHPPIVARTLEYVTKDADFLIRADRRNRERLAVARREIGVDDVTTSDDLTGNTQWETDAGPGDILVHATGFSATVIVYADIASRTEVFKLGESGVTVTAVGLDDLIQMKEAANCHKDHFALLEPPAPPRQRAHRPDDADRPVPLDFEYGADDD